MNGQHHLFAAISRPVENTCATDHSTAASRRLLVALLFSCLLHFSIVVMPYLGKNQPGHSPIRQTVNKTTRPISVSLTPQRPSKNPTSRVDPIDQSPPSRQSEDDSDTPPSPSHPPAPAEADKTTPPEAPAKGAELLPLPASIYFATNQLTKRPQPLGEIELDTPQTRAVVASGRLILKLWINESGEVANVEVEKTELPEIFSKTAVAAFKNLSFSPGERNGIRVGNIMRIEISYVDGRVTPP